MKSMFPALTLALFAAPVLADGVDIQWNEAGRFQHETTLKAGAVLEVCGKLPAQLGIDWSFASSAPMEANIHYHEGKQVVFPAKHAAAAMLKDRLNTKVAQDYCWMWSNRSKQAVQIKLELKKIS